MFVLWRVFKEEPATSPAHHDGTNAMTATPRHTSRTFRSDLMLVAVAAVGLLAGNLWSGTAFGQSLSPMTSFGVNGWVAPTPIVAGTNYVTTGDNNRGLAWNPITKNLVLPTRTAGNPVAILDGLTGTTVKVMNSGTTITGGAVAMSQTGVTDDGQIFVSNIQNSSSVFSFYKVYGWSSESGTSAPNLALNMNIPVASSGGTIRLGDAFAVTGTGSSIRFAAAGSTNSGTTNGFVNNSNFLTGVIDTVNTNTGTYTLFQAIPSTLTATNDYRLALTFIDGDTVIGNQGASAKLTDFLVSGTGSTGSGATVTAAIPLSAAQRGMDYTVIGGIPYLAVVDTNSSIVSVLDITSPTSPVTVASLTTTTGSTNGNLNGAGQVAWGDITNLGGGLFSAQLYALNSNNGVQAMVFAVPEPSTYALLGGAFAAIGVIASRKRQTLG
jgi:hypothetical protein